jgi:hypothetical protein
MDQQKRNAFRRRRSKNHREVSLSPQQQISRSTSNRSLVCINPNHLPVAPDLPHFLQSSCSTSATRSDDDDESFTMGMLLSSSSYYIPGITEKSRLLLNDNDRISATKGSARNLYTPNTCSRSLDYDSFSSLPSQEGHSYLPLVLEFSPEELLDEDSDDDASLGAARNHRHNNRSSIDANVGISPSRLTEGGKIQPAHYSSHPHQEHQRTSRATKSAKALLQAQLGSIQDVWEEHDSRKGVETFRMHQVIKQEKKQHRRQKKEKARSSPEPPHQRSHRVHNY